MVLMITFFLICIISVCFETQRLSDEFLILKLHTRSFTNFHRQPTTVEILKLEEKELKFSIFNFINVDMRLLLSVSF